jgi:dTMP kinase
MKKGLFITLEGIDGSGKSTLAQGLVKALTKQGLDVLATRAPGGTELGSKIRDMILHGHVQDMKTELFLFLADRAEHVTTLIRPALEQGKIVICDRFSDSTVAYQASRGLEAGKVMTFCDYATGGLKPDLTLFVDIDPQVAYSRVEKARHKDRIENEGLYLLTKIHQAYLDIAKDNPRIVKVDGLLSASELLQVCLDHAFRLIDSKST